MKQSGFPNSSEKYWLIALFILLVISLFLDLGSYPLYLEEPRRALIAMEMLIRDNWIVPTQYGEFYYRKPPVWNWMIILGWKLFGYNEFGVRFFGVVSYILIGLAIFLTARRYVGERFAFYASFFFLVMSDGIFYITVVTGEIDVFYALISFAMFMLIFHFLQKEQYYLLFISAYLLTAVGTLTKGLPSLVFTALTLLVAFVDQKKFMKLFHPGHFVGVGLLVLLVGGYLYLYEQQHDVNALLFSEGDSIFAQTTGKSFLSTGIGNILIHLSRFPLEFLSKIFPAVFLLIFVFQKGVWRKWMKQPFIRYAILVFGVNILVYWLSPATRSRYLYMLFPLPILVLVYAAFINDKDWPKKAMTILNYILLIVLILVLFLSPVIPIETLNPLENYKWIFPLLGVFSVAFLYVYIKNQRLLLLPVIVIMITMRIAFDFTALPIKAGHSNMQVRKSQGIEIAKILEGQPAYIYRDTEEKLQRIFYVERDARKVIGFKSVSDTINYFLVHEKYLADPSSYTSFYQYKDKGRVTHLVKFLKKID